MDRNQEVQVVSIPAKENVKKLLRKYSTKERIHPGLKASYTSLKHGRHHKNAYIILLGQTGAGKSTTINTLFGRNLAEVGEETSVTSQIFEYASPVETMKELGVANAGIHIIDTPGLSDVRGIEQDAKFIATMDEFLSTHKELKDVYPNVVILTARMDDNRVKGAASSFVRMIKGIKLLEERLIDPQHSNVIVVLTHFMHMKKHIQKNPQENYDLIKKLVKEYGGFPDPIFVVAAENEAEEYELETLNGYWKLPCEEYYPYNLFEGICKLCSNYDPMGDAIIRHAFAGPNVLCTKTVNMKYLIEDTSNKLYSKAIGELIGNQFSNQKSEISDKLKSIWNSLISPELRKSYPEALVVTQTVFILRNIRNISDIPKDPVEKIRLIRSIPQNEAILQLLRKGLDIYAPPMKIPLIVGHGYNILIDEPLPSTPFAKSETVISSLGYSLPSHLKCEMLDESVDICAKVDSKQQYVIKRLADLGLTVANVNIEIPKGCRPGYSITVGQSKLSMLKEHRKFKLSLKDEFVLNVDFMEALTLLEKPDANIPSSIESWKTFFLKYGTHVVRQAYGGGSIEFTMEGQKFNQQIERLGGKEVIMQKMKNMESELESGINVNNNDLSIIAPKFRGGDQQNVNSMNWEVGSEESESLLANWVVSLEVTPVMLETHLKLLPLSEFVKAVDAKKSKLIETAMMFIMKQHMLNVEVSPEKKFVPLPRSAVTKSHNTDDKSSCLKEGTRILMSDFTFKPVEKLVQGDSILDKDLKPCSVLGCNYFFLGDRKYYGFSPESQFFTEVHLFVSPGMQLKVVSKEALLDENPAFENFDVSPMEDEFTLLGYDKEKVVERTCRLFVDNTVYPRDEKVYFIEVDSPSGTYYANEYLCRHELPPFHLWPKTFDCLQKMMLSPKIITKIINEPFNPSTISKFSRIGKSVADAIIDRGIFDKDNCNSNDSVESRGQEIMDISKNLSLVLENKSLAAFGLLLYSKCGKILHNNLDKQIDSSDCIRTVPVNMLRSIVEEKLLHLL